MSHRAARCSRARGVRAARPESAGLAGWIVGVVARLGASVVVGLVAGVGALAGCGPAPEPVNPSLPPHQTPGWVPAAAARKAVDFHGTCNWGRAPGDPARYRIALRARPDPSGAVLVRRDAWFDLDDPSNTLGELPSGAVVFGDGPVSAPGSPFGAGYAILLRGHTGRVCRGYVSADYVEVVTDR